MLSSAALRQRLGRGFDGGAAALPGWALPAAIGGLALLLRLHGLGDKPFWLDEITSLKRATLGLDDLVRNALRAHHYPSYFLLLWAVARLGVEQWLLRLPSALFGALAAALAAVVGRRAAGPRAGAVAGLLMALSPLEVQLGQEARSYTLVATLILTALWGLVRLAQTPEAAALPLRRREAMPGAWLAYCLGTAGALSVLAVAVPWLFAANLAAATVAWRAGMARRAFLRRWGLAQALVVALWAPSLAALLLLGDSGLAGGAAWAPPESAAAIWATLAPVYLLRIPDFISFELAPAAVPGLPFVVAGLALAGAWRLRRDPRLLAVLGAAALLLPLGAVLLSPWVPVLVPRYLAWSAAPFFILAAAGLRDLPRAGFAASAAALAGVGLLNLAPYYGYETKPRWDLAAARLAAEARPGDIALADRGYTYYVFSVFAEAAGLAGRGVHVAHELPEAAALAPGHDVWALYGRIGQQDIVPPEEYLASIASLGRPVAAYPVGRYITLYRIEVPPPPSAAAAPQP